MENLSNDLLRNIEEVATILKQDSLFSEDSTLLKSTLISIQRLLCESNEKVIQHFVDCEIIPRLIKCLEYTTDAAIQTDAARSLLNISDSSAHTQYLVNRGIVPVLLSMFESPNLSLWVDCVGILGNIATDKGSALSMLQRNVLSRLLGFCKLDCSAALLESITWCISNLTKHMKSPGDNLHYFSALLPVVELLLECRHNEVLLNVLIAFKNVSSYFTDAFKNLDFICSHFPNLLTKMIQQIPRVQNITDAPTRNRIYHVVIRICAQFAAGNNGHTQAVIDASSIPALVPLLSSENAGIKLGLCWMLSNVAAGTQSQVQTLMDSNLLPLIINIIATDSFNVSVQAIHVLCNLVVHAANVQLINLLKEPTLICTFSYILDQVRQSNDAQLVKVALLSLKRILDVRQTPEANFYAKQLKDEGGVYSLNYLAASQYQSEESKLAANILETYYQEA